MKDSLLTISARIGVLFDDLQYVLVKQDLATLLQPNGKPFYKVTGRTLSAIDFVFLLALAR